MPQQAISLHPKSQSSLMLSEVSEKNHDDATSFKKRRNGLSNNNPDDQPVDEIIMQFGTEVQKVMSSKRRKIENFTVQCNASREKLNSALATQRTGRALLHEEFRKQISLIMSQWQNDIDQIQENEDKLVSMWNQHMKLISQTRMMQTERFNSMKSLHEQYLKSFNDLEVTHIEQHNIFSKESTKELCALQNKFLAETRNHEVSNIRKSLQSLLYQ